MKKTNLIAILESEKQKFSEKPKQFNKCLIKYILFEAQNLPNIMDIEKMEKEGGIATLPTIEKQKEQVKEEKPKSVIKFATDIGIKAIIFDNNFMEIDEQGRNAISNIFSGKELKVILDCKDCNDWKPIERDPLYCLKPQVDKGTKRMRCYNPELKRFGEYNGKYVLTVYKREDEKNKVKNIRDPRFKNKNTGEIREVPYVLMNPAHNEEIYMLPLGNKKYAIALQLPYQPDPYIFKMSYPAMSFFHKPKK